MIRRWRWSRNSPGRCRSGWSSSPAAIAWLYLKTRAKASLALADNAPIPPHEAAIR